MAGGLAGSARILRADNGSEVTCEELVRSDERPMVWSLDDRGRMRPHPLIGAVSARRQEGFMLRLASGRQVEAAADTRLLTIGGRTPLRSLVVGDRVGVPRRVPVPLNPQSMVDDEVVVLAHMIGDGSASRTNRFGTQASTR